MFTRRFRYRESNWIEMVSEYFWRTFCGGQNHPFQSLNSCFTWSVSQSILRILYVCVCLASCLLLTMLLLNNRKRNREKKHTPEHLRPKCAPHAYYMLWKSTVNCLCIIDLSLHSVYKMQTFRRFFFFYLAQTRYKWRAKKNSDNHI